MLPAFADRLLSHRMLRPGLAAGGAMLLGEGIRWSWPAIELEVFARSTASLVAIWHGAVAERIDLGWLLVGSEKALLVSTACSGAGYFLIVAALVAAQVARRGRFWPGAMLAGLAVAFPIAIFVNALRVITLGQLHRWVIPQFPAAYAHFLHLLGGVGVFLPALILLNLALERHGRRRPPSAVC